MNENTNEPVVVASGQHICMLNKNGWEYVDRVTPSGLVCIVAVTDDHELVLVEQFRPPLDANIIELPAGLVGDIPGEEDESLLQGAKRELLEETGFEAGEWSLLTSGPPSAGLATEVLNLFWARGLTRREAGGGDDSENIVVHTVPLADLDSWFETQRERGAMIDFKIFSGLYFVERSGWLDTSR